MHTEKSIAVLKKISKAKKLLRKLKHPRLDWPDRLDLIQPFMIGLAHYGIVKLTISTFKPSFNDGEPCILYVGDYVKVQFKTSYLHPDYGTFDDSEDLTEHEEVDEFEEYLKSFVPTGTDIPTTAEIDLMWLQIKDLFNVLLDMDSLEDNCHYVYYLDEEGILEEDTNDNDNDGYY